MAATLIGFTGVVLGAEPPELAELAPAWDATFTLNGGAGYKDNVFLSHAAPQSSAFASAGAEMMALRLAPAGPQFNFFGNVDAQRFLAAEAEHTEVLAYGQAQLEQEFGDRWKGSLAAQYLYQDQILDISVSETNREAVGVTGHRLTIRPGARLNLAHQLWVAVELAASRQFFRSPLDDYWELGPTLTLGRNLGRRSEISLGYSPAWLAYDNTSTWTETGETIPGSQRRRFQQEVRLNWRQTWDKPQRWRTTVTLGTRLNEENGGGYFDYSRWLVSARIEYRREPWRFSAGARLAYLDYAHQTVSASDTSKRRRAEVTFNARVERRLGKRLKLVASYEYEQVLSNDALAAYAVNTVSATLQFEF